MTAVETEFRPAGVASGPMWGIRFLTTVDGQIWCRLVGAWENSWLKSFDPDHRGCGRAEFTDDVREAMKFPSFDAAKACWMQQSVTEPIRDGVENRPLARSTHVSIDPLP